MFVVSSKGESQERNTTGKKGVLFYSGKENSEFFQFKFQLINIDKMAESENHHSVTILVIIVVKIINDAKMGR